MEGDVPEPTVTLRSDLRAVIAGLPLFSLVSGRPRSGTVVALRATELAAVEAGRVGCRRLASELVKALARFGRAELVWSVRGAAHTSHWLSTDEASNDFVVYVGDATVNAWTNLCVRQADALMLVAVRTAHRANGRRSRISGMRTQPRNARSWYALRELLGW